MYDAVKMNDPGSKVGLVYNLEAVAPKDPMEPLDVQAAKNLSYLLNDVFVNAVTFGDLDAKLDGTTVHRDDLANRMDYLGINYYARVIAQSAASPFPTLSPLLTVSIGSLVNQDYDYPQGMYEVITLAKKWKVPMFITETGVQDAMDSGIGPAWLVRTLAGTKRAMNEGADVQGYFWWTLMDNYEWNHGMAFHMGMYAVDPKDAMKARKPRQTVSAYARIVQSSSIPADLLMKYPAPR
jgi:beta-glucosidase/6-phospho-beta-glucosidase/beta-galactosidase